MLMRDVSLFKGEQMESILTALPDPVFILTRSGRYAAIFGGSDSRYYHDGSGLIGKTMFDVLVDDKAAWFMQQIAQALDSRELHVVEYGLCGSDVRGLSSDDGPLHKIWFEGRIKTLDFTVDGEDAVLWVASNITERNLLESQLRILSETDPLSGLYNRRKLMTTLAEHHATFLRYGTPTSVLIFDIDHFKHINDQYGHLQGDAAIEITARVCRAELRVTDIPARLGGDEFVVLMPHTTRDGAGIIAERLRLRVAEELRAAGTLGDGATISGGLSELMAGDASTDAVLKRADDALYRSKRDGRDRISVG